MLKFMKALCDLGVIINLIPYALQSSWFRWNEINNNGITYSGVINQASCRIQYDILVNLHSFIFPKDFVIIDCDIDDTVPIIFWRPFVETKIAIMDVERGKLKVYVIEDEVTFNIFISIKQPSDINVLSIKDVLDQVVESAIDLMQKRTPQICACESRWIWCSTIWLNGVHLNRVWSVYKKSV